MILTTGAIDRHMDDRYSHFLPLGYPRLRLLGCLGGDTPSAPSYFAPAPETDIFEAFCAYVTNMSEMWVNESDPLGVSLLAAARLLTGDLDAAGIIVDHLPEKVFKLDHGGGYCAVVPQSVLCTSMPLPAVLTDIDRWLADSEVQAALRKWLKVNRESLSWCEKIGVYQLQQ
jgi:hypothetical protein